MHAKSYSASDHNDIVSGVGRSLQEGDKRLCFPMGGGGGNHYIPIKEVHKKATTTKKKHGTKNKRTFYNMEPMYNRGQCLAKSPFWVVFQVFKFFDFP